MNPPTWELIDFVARLDGWVARENPPQDWVNQTLAWFLLLRTHPHAAATRQANLGYDQWLAQVPNANDVDRATVCFYSTDEVARVARCSVIAILDRPIW